MPKYKITQTLVQGDDRHEVERLVDAKNKAQAIQHVAADSIKCETATDDDLIRLTKDGVNVEQA